jgi:hypothetical protein
VRVDPATGELCYARAGHPPALLVDADGRATWLRDVIGIPLGAVDDAVFTEGAAQLEPGSTLVLYSDGLVELRGETLDVGLERLARATAAAPSPARRAAAEPTSGTAKKPQLEPMRARTPTPARSSRSRPSMTPLRAFIASVRISMTRASA